MLPFVTWVSFSFAAYVFLLVLATLLDLVYIDFDTPGTSKTMLSFERREFFDKITFSVNFDFRIMRVGGSGGAL